MVLVFSVNLQVNSCGLLSYYYYTYFISCSVEEYQNQMLKKSKPLMNHSSGLACVNKSILCVSLVHVCYSVCCQHQCALIATQEDDLQSVNLSGCKRYSTACRNTVVPPILTREQSEN